MNNSKNLDLQIYSVGDQYIEKKEKISLKERLSNKKQINISLNKIEEDQKTIFIYEKKGDISYEKTETNDKKSKMTRNSLNFISKQEEIMKNFQNDFINIYEGKSIENSYISPNTAVPIMTEEEQKNDFFTKETTMNLASPKTNFREGKKNNKKEKIQKILLEIEKKKRKKIEIEGLNKDPNLKERDCCNSKIVRKKDKVDLNIY